MHQNVQCKFDQISQVMPMICVQDDIIQWV